VTHLILTLMLLTAQIGLEPTAIAIGAPSSAVLGDVVTFQGRLVDSTGYPVGKANVEFAVPLSFLDGQGDVVVASALTNEDGLAVATWRVRSTGDLVVNASFAGDKNYAASSASTSLSVTGDQQLYTPTAGVQIPGVNEGPLPSAWPVVLVLLAVWSLYGVAAAQLFRVATGGRRR
jgi:hypothetical protein